MPDVSEQLNQYHYLLRSYDSVGQKMRYVIPPPDFFCYFIHCIVPFFGLFENLILIPMFMPLPYFSQIVNSILIHQ